MLSVQRASPSMSDLLVPMRISQMTFPAFDGIVVMGGPMSAYSDEGFPTRRRELELLADALVRGVPTLGVCLGAQLLALAAGGRALAGKVGPEVGWAPVEFTEHAKEDSLLAGLPRQIIVLHWHGDTFELPPHAVELAASPLYRGQAFRVGSQAWGFQFHLEVDQQGRPLILASVRRRCRTRRHNARGNISQQPGSVRRLETPPRPGARTICWTCREPSAT